MEENKDIDNIFRDALDSMEMEPSAKSWNALSSDLSRKKVTHLRRRRVLWFSMAALLFIAGITGYKIFTGNQQKKNNTDQFVPVQTNDDSASSQINNSDSRNTNDKKSVSSESNPSENNSSENNSSENNSSENNSSENASTVNTPVETSSRSVNATQQSSSETNMKTSVADTKSQTTSVTENKKDNTVVSEKPKAKTGKVNPVLVAPAAIPVVHNVNKNGNTVSANATKTEKTSPSNQATPDNSSIQKTSDDKTSHVKSDQNNSLTNPNDPANANPANSNVQSKTTDPVITNDPAKNGNIPIAPLVAAPAAVAAQGGNSGNSNMPSNNSENNSAPATSDNNAGDNKKESPTSTDTKPGEVNTPVDSTKKPGIADYAQTQKPDSTPSLLKKVISHLSLGVYYSPEYVNDHMTVNSDYVGPASTNLDDYSDRKGQYSYSTGAELKYNIGKRWVIGSGVAFSSYTMNAVYNSISVVSDSVYQEVYVNSNTNPGGGSGSGGSGSGGSGSGGSGGGNGGGSGHGGGHGGSSHGGGHGGGWGGGHSGGHNTHGPPNSHNDHHYVIHTPCGDIDLNHEPENGSVSSNGDTLKVKTETEETVHFINIPLFIRYNMGQNKLSYFIEAGGSYNKVVRDKVKVTVSDYTEESYLNGLNSVNYSLTLGFGAEYKIYKGLSMYLKPSIRYSITPVNLDSPVNSYPYFIGIAGGVSFHF